DPVIYGWVESIAHPGGNVTGYVGQPDLPDKRLEFFKAVAPDLRTLLVLIDLEDPTIRTVLPIVHRTATVLNVDLLEEAATSEADKVRVRSVCRTEPGAEGASPRRGGASGRRIDRPKSGRQNLGIQLRHALLRQSVQPATQIVELRDEIGVDGASLAWRRVV